MDSRSSVEAAPIGAFVAWLLATAASAQFALFLQEVLGPSSWLAWGIALLAFGWGARLGSYPGQERKLILSQFGLMATPIMLLLLGLMLGSSALASVAGAFLGVFAVGWGLAVPVSQWIAGTAPPRADGRPSALPLPGASFAIALFFALPAPRILSAVAGMSAVAALVLAASLGAIAGRTDKGGRVAASPGLWTRWGGLAALLAITAGLVGFVASNIVRPTSLLGHPTDVPPLPQNAQPNLVTTTTGSPQPDPAHPNPIAPNPPPSQQDPTRPRDDAPNSSGQGSEGSGSSQAGAERPPRDWREYLRLAAVALIAFAALALARRYGDRIQAWLNRWLARLGGPLASLGARWRQKREMARLWAHAEAMGDPFAPPATPAERAARLEATLAALEVPRRADEPPGIHLRRALAVIGGDSERWQAAIRAVNRIRFSSRADEKGDEWMALVALDEELFSRLSQAPDAAERRRNFRLSLAREEAISPEPTRL